MTRPAVETRNLSHRFGREPVLRGVDITVPAGAIYGFLGPNGAGKTTTLRLLLGLLRRQAGTIQVFGQTLEHHRLAILRRVGSSIESPSLYGHLTAVENLEVWRRAFHCDRRRIADVLDLVGLADTRAKRADQFSLGMKQRLAIAIALLHEPALLVLDEPTNGLDPHGILEVRHLLAALSRQRGITILVSSHILAEIERLVTHVGVIHRGTMRFEGTLDALREYQAKGSLTVVDTSDNRVAIALAGTLGFAGRMDAGKAVFAALSREDTGRMTTRLGEAGVTIYEVATVRRDLEQIFLDLVGGAE
jgi:ABC-2 type transport system ATP-binding protein